MTGLDRRGALAGIGLLFATAVGAVATPRRHLADELPPFDPEREVPREFGDWRVDQSIVPVLPSPDVQERLDKLYNKTLSRTYVDRGGQHVMFVVAYGADQADRMTLAHLPESCYSSQGFDVEPTTIASIAVGAGTMKVVHLLSRKGLRREPITYWTTVGERQLVDEVSRRWERARYSLLGIVPDGMLVRVSSIDADADRAFALHARFITQVRAAIGADTRARLFGAMA